MSKISTSAITTFAAGVFAADADENPIFVDSRREVRKTAKTEARTVNFKAPQLKVSPLQFAIALATAKAGVATEHKVKTKNPDGTETESVVTSTLLADEVNEFIADRAEDATEAYLNKGQIVEYFGSFIVGVSKDRETEKAVSDKLNKMRSDFAELTISLDGEWTEDSVRATGCADAEAANTKRANLLAEIVRTKAKLTELQAAKSARDAKKAGKA